MKWKLVLCLLIMAAAGCTQPPQPIRVATYNLRNSLANDGVNAWPNRKAMVRDLITKYDFDIVGTQEGLIDQISDLEELTAYRRSGVGRDDGGQEGEHSAIFFKKERFELLDSGDFWLSETPGRPSLGWDALHCRRICSWVELKDRRDGKTLFVFCAHFDHEGPVARRESARLVLSKIAEIAGTHPAIFMGDLNSQADDEPVTILSATLQDSHTVTQTPPTGPADTFTGFRWQEPFPGRIDYIFVTPGIGVLDYTVIDDSRNQRYPSDHFPVMASVILP
ncbi:MAG: endonuclease/exonuclease/phosphatase family protein [Rikenellaceae bacterium]|nr:endonuclease/exonuclease/phosphatase family protein [Rikenellaceae bacterium]